MRTFSLVLVALVCCVAAPLLASAQTPVKNGMKPQAPQSEPEPTAEEAQPAPEQEPVYEAPEPAAVFVLTVAPTPAPKKDEEPAIKALDAARTAETFTNSMIGGSGNFDPSLGALTTGDPTIDGYIVDSSQRHGVDPKLVYAVMQQESTFKQGAVSPKGACGYMQLMPGTARRFGVTDIFDPKQNIDAGTRYLRFLLDLFDNNVELALAGYNAGEYRVIREGYRVPQIRETQNYVRVISSRYYSRSSKRHFSVTYGPSTIGKKEREEYFRTALITTEDRDSASLSNIN
jgi:soluble lytic murein transglycosylase-like protein